VTYAEGGYRTWQRSSDLRPPGADLASDLLEAAEVWASLTEPRPGRGALDASRAAVSLEGAVAAGLLDEAAVGAVLAASGHQPRLRAPADPALTDREVQVLRLAARGLTNRTIAAQLGISDRTVGHHLAHAYDKTGRRTRAGVAVWAVERRLLP
jgi:DNA-binding NarL/FixJ family response regulator